MTPPAPCGMLACTRWLAILHRERQSSERGPTHIGRSDAVHLKSLRTSTARQQHTGERATHKHGTCTATWPVASRHNDKGPGGKALIALWSFFPAKEWLQRSLSSSRLRFRLLSRLAYWGAPSCRCWFQWNTACPAPSCGPWCGGSVSTFRVWAGGRASKCFRSALRRHRVETDAHWNLFLVAHDPDTYGRNAKPTWSTATNAYSSALMYLTRPENFGSFET